MKFKSALLTQGSGSIGGMTIAHNAGGMYARARTVPVQPNTTFQSQVKAAFTELVVRWTETLTAAERAAWNLYAANVPITNALGDTINISGQNWYIAANTPRTQAESKFGSAVPIVDTAPGIFNRGDFPTPVDVEIDAGNGITFSVNDTAAWANEDDAFMFVYQGQPRNAARNYFRGPWRLVGKLDGSSISAPTDITVTPANAAVRGFPLIEGQAINLAVAVSRADGRLSTRRDLGTEIVTSV